MTPTENETMIDPTDRALGDRLGGSMNRVGASVQPTIPLDGPARVGAGARRRQRTRQLTSGLAAAVVLVLLVSGLSVVARQRGDEGPPVFAGPVESEWAGVPLLAPQGVDWSPTIWTAWSKAGSTTVTSYASFFEADGFAWNFDVHDLANSSPDLRKWVDGADDLTGVSTLEMAGRTVRYLPEGQNTQGVGADGLWEIAGYGPMVWWTEPDGSWASLEWSDPGLPEQPAVAPDQAEFERVLATIQPEQPDEWLAAAGGMDGVITAGGSEAMLLRLGLSDPTVESVFHVMGGQYSAWIRTSPDGPWLNLQVIAEYPESATPPEGVESHEVSVRGVTGLNVIHSDLEMALPPFEDPTANPADAFVAGSIRWIEGGTAFTLSYPQSVSADEAVTFANSLVELDSAQWEHLLAP